MINFYLLKLSTEKNKNACSINCECNNSENASAIFKTKSDAGRKKIFYSLGKSKKYYGKEKEGKEGKEGKAPVVIRGYAATTWAEQSCLSRQSLPPEGLSLYKPAYGCIEGYFELLCRDVCHSSIDGSGTAQDRLCAKRSLSSLR